VVQLKDLLVETMIGQDEVFASSGDYDKPKETVEEIQEVFCCILIAHGIYFQP
jgi:hypothetical protein